MTDLTDPAPPFRRAFDSARDPLTARNALGIGTPLVADGSITTDKLVDGAVTTPKLADNSVTSVKIVDGTIATADIADNAISNAKLRDSGPLSIIGRSANSTGDPADISATAVSDAVLRESGSTLGFGTIATGGIANDAITYAKIQNVSATSRILGRKTASAGDVEECTLSEILDFISSAAQGDILYRGASTWARLAAGTSGQFLKTNGTGADPAWTAAGGTGDVVGPGSATDNAIARFDSTTGKLIQNSSVTIDDDGNMLQPSMAAFHAFNSATDSNVTGNNVTATIDFDTEVFDRGNDFTADTFTAPVTGIYQLSCAVDIGDYLSASGHTSFTVNIVASNRTRAVQYLGPSAAASPGAFLSGGGSVLMDMDAGDTAIIQIVVAGGSQTVDVFGSAAGNFTWFTGSLVG